MPLKGITSQKNRIFNTKNTDAREFTAAQSYGKGPNPRAGFDDIAIKALVKAAEQGYARDQHRLGNMYYHGTGIPQDYAEAAKWFERAAEQGHAEAQAALGGGDMRFSSMTQVILTIHNLWHFGQK